MVNKDTLIFKGEIVIISNKGDTFNQSIDYLKKQKKVGFDTESKPTFQKGTLNKISLIQFATYDKALLFRITDNIADEIIEILSNPNILKIGNGIKNDLQHITKITGFVPESFIDIQTIAKDKGYNKVNLKYLCKEILNKHLSKKQQLSNWAAPVLTRDQCIYAATDAYACLLIYDALLNERDNIKKE
ncbi:MAG: 3'-5' exonuclease domain-containing protein 2 [Bacteroidales bacterium]|nr:3'-5' exonuclease domain-containing protein 2 [Bacteroidales bacterium]